MVFSSWPIQVRAPHNLKSTGLKRVIVLFDKEAALLEGNSASWQESRACPAEGLLNQALQAQVTGDH